MPDKTPEKGPGKLQPTATQGELSAAGLRFGIVVSRFNSFITERLLAGALDALQRAGAKEKQIELVRVPGSLEIPVAAKKLGASGRCDAIICIGCVIRGETTHFEHVSSEVARGVQIAQLDTGVPMAFCVLTCETLEQAIDRAGLKSGNKGFDAGLAAIEMANLLPKLAPARKLNETGKSRPRTARHGSRRGK
jgi:6,7-dimethyl-8-ribityllumazine synthase